MTEFVTYPPVKPTKGTATKARTRYLYNSFIFPLCLITFTCSKLFIKNKGMLQSETTCF